ncbi:MAG: hypothetical protein NW226_05490 [Microscillaceae bacterium]|nr:hypothetical protein [Microscillaceae bacterium]
MAKKGLTEKTVGKVVEGALKGVDNLLDALNPFKEEEKKKTAKKPVAKKTTAKKTPVSKTTAKKSTSAAKTVKPTTSKGGKKKK